MGNNEQIIDSMTSYKMEINKENSYNFLMCLDANLYLPLFTLLASIRENMPQNYNINIYILESGFNEEQIKVLKKFCLKNNLNIFVHEMPDLDFRGFALSWEPFMAYYYIIAHKILPAYIDKILYLDVDILVLKDISPFYNIYLENTWLAACNAYNGKFFDLYFKLLESNSFNYTQNSLRSEEIYNAGVLLLNLKKFRENNVDLNTFKKIVRIDDSTNKSGEQVLLNRYTRCNIKLLPQEFFNYWPRQNGMSDENFKGKGTNEIYSRYKYDQNLAGSIVHFIPPSPQKPWKCVKFFSEKELYFVNIPFSEYYSYVKLWWDYASLTPPEIYYQLLLQSVQFNMAADNKIKEKILQDKDNRIKSLGDDNTLKETMLKEKENMINTLTADNNIKQGIIHDKVEIIKSIEGKLMKLSSEKDAIKAGFIQALNQYYQDINYNKFLNLIFNAPWQLDPNKKMLTQNLNLKDIFKSINPVYKYKEYKLKKDGFNNLGFHMQKDGVINTANMLEKYMSSKRNRANGYENIAKNCERNKDIAAIDYAYLAYISDPQPYRLKFFAFRLYKFGYHKPAYFIIRMIESFSSFSESELKAIEIIKSNITKEHLDLIEKIYNDNK